MSQPLKLLLIGDYSASAVAHQAIPLAIERVAARRRLAIEYRWQPTSELDDLHSVQHSDAVWLAEKIQAEPEA